MKKFFLIPLLTLMCSVMAWGSEITVNNFADLKTALSSEGTADVVKLGANITYGSELLNIQRSLTLDGNGFTINGSIVDNFSISNDITFNRNAIFAVNKGGATDAGLVVTVQNLELTHSSNTRREIPFVIFDGVTKFTLDKVKTLGNNKDFQSLLITGADNTPVQLVIKDSEIDNLGNYPMYILKPITATLTNTTISGYCGMYFKYQWTKWDGSEGYGNTVGSAGSVVTATACTFNCPNPYAGASNNFAIFPIEDHNITLNLHNCSFNVDNLANNNGQRLVNLQYNARSTSLGDVYVNITGDNTHVYNVENADPKKVIWNGFVVGQGAPSAGEGLSTQTSTDLHVTVSGGTFNVNLDDIRWFTAADNKPKATVDNGTYNDQSTGTGKITIPNTHKLQEVKQGSVTLYRVVKNIDISYDINENYETAVDGENPNTSFIVQDNAPVALVNNTTEAAYVQVKENNTVLTVGKATADQTLVINNGLDVQDNAQVVVKSGSAIVIGEGGIVTEKPENIVVEANQSGAASLLLDPTITVNQTPELTVKMTVPAEHAGYEMLGSGQYRHWHRFAMPVKHMDAVWAKEPSVPTYLYGWDYSAQEWAQVGVTEMVPFAGYTLSPDKEISTNTAVTYTFKGQLLGNTNCKLNLNHHGYNFFGNSYTGYISILKLVDQIMGDAKIDGTVWMWDGEKYQGVGLEYLRQYENVPGMIESWKKEVAPMQTFVLRLTGEDFSSTDINYADAIWGNPRYDAAKTALNAAPARRAEINDDAIIRMTIEANGQKESVVMIENSNYSDAYDRGYDAIKYMNENCFNTYVGVNGENYGTVATDNLEGKMLNIKTNNELAYSITFDFVAGEEYALRDNLTGNVIAIEEGATYEFAAQPNSTVEGRFEIVAAAKMPTSIENTEVKANVKGIYTIMGQYLGEDFEALPAGVYVVDGVKIVK